ncbi:hypothetical protein EP7_000008 [Isosphaeraceae bacterium EP7]
MACQPSRMSSFSLSGTDSVEMIKSFVNAFITWSLISAMGIASRLPAAEPSVGYADLLRQARQIGESLPSDGIDDFFSRATLLRDVAIAEAAAGDLMAADRLVNALPLRPDITLPWKIDCNILTAQPQSKAGGMTQAVETLRRAAVEAAGLSRPAARVDAWARIAAALSSIGRKDAAEKLIQLALSAAEELPPILPRNSREAGMNKALSLATIALVQWQMSDHEASEVTVKASLIAGAAIEDELEKAGTLAHMAIGRARVGDSTGGLRLLDLWASWFGLRARASLSFALSQIARLQDSQGSPEEATRTAGRILEPMERAESYLAMARARTAAGDRPGAKKRLDQARAAARTVLNTSAKAGLICRIASALVETGDLSAGKALANESLSLLEQADISTVIQSLRRAVVGGPDTPRHNLPNFQAAVAIVLAKAGDTKSARELLGRALRSARSIEDRTGRMVVLGEIGLAQIDVEGADAAFATYGLIDTSFNGLKLRLGRAIAMSQAKSGDLAGASKTLSSFPQDARQAFEIAGAAEEIAEALATSILAEKVSEWAELQTIPIAKGRALLGAGRGLSKRRAPETP